MPQRFLRPGITNSDNWNACAWDTQSFYVRILTLVDDFGRFDGRLSVLHAYCFALRTDIKPARTSQMRNELVFAKLIDVYSVDGKEYLQVLRWKERARSDRSQYPDPQDFAADRSEPQPSAASLVPRSKSSPSPSVIGERDFSKEAEEVYLLYPIKVGKPDALKSIRRALEKHAPEFLKDRVKAYVAARSGDLSYVPNPATWFNQERFNDDPETWLPKTNGQGKPVVKTKLDIEYEEAQRRHAERKANQQ